MPLDIVPALVLLPKSYRQYYRDYYFSWKHMWNIHATVAVENLAPTAVHSCRIGLKNKQHVQTLGTLGVRDAADIADGHVPGIYIYDTWYVRSTVSCANIENKNRQEQTTTLTTTTTTITYSDTHKKQQQTMRV